jgi:HD-GYP domain-containing protein (c-di-GMP phosphodiesterase class II)
MLASGLGWSCGGLAGPADAGEPKFARDDGHCILSTVGQPPWSIWMPHRGANWRHMLMAMSDAQSSGEERIRAAEVIASLCLATDLGMGLPFEHGLHATLMAMRLCDVLEVDRETASQAFFVSLLMHSGCTTDAHVMSKLTPGGALENVNPRFYGSFAERVAGGIRAATPPDGPAHQRAYGVVVRIPVAARHLRTHTMAACEVAEMLADRLGLPPAVSHLFRLFTERWDGKGALKRAKGVEVPLPLRIVHVATDVGYQRVLRADINVADVIRQRAGHAFDTEVAKAFGDNDAEILAVGGGSPSAWVDVLAAEPQPWLTLNGDAVDRAVAAMGAFSDLVSPYLSGHSAGVAELAAAAAELCGFGDAEVRAVRRAGHLHDLGRVAVHPRVWEQYGPLTADDWEQIRLHPYHTERVLARSPALSRLGLVAGAHHERLDGSGYPKGVTAASLSASARLLAAADAYRAKTEPRSYRPARPPEQAANTLADKARRGLLDADMVAAVLAAAGQKAPRLERPAGLTEREAQVLALLARGMLTKQIAHSLHISVKTADHHIQSVYRKIGVSTRAAATLFAMEHGLV